jgi:hypothetical protein
VTGKAEAPEPWRSSAVLSDLLHHSANKGKTGLLLRATTLFINEKSPLYRRL